jgi:AcrR family transcriptional regulator
MKSTSRSATVTPGLRERKKVKTFTTIQQQALRLFREQGYDATTIEQIAAASEISPSTFFRYFATKEDVVIRDLYDAMIVEAVRAQPADLNPIEAARRAMKEVFSRLPAEEIADMWVRVELARGVPELRAAMIDELTRSLQVFAAVLAERLGCDGSDFRVRTFSGVILGVSLAIMVSVMEQPGADIDYFAQLDASLAFIEAGMPF